MEEATTVKEKDIIEEIESYGQHQDIITANRDGDLFYVECPECHSTDLNAKRIIACRKCHTFFSVYFEDGFYRHSVLTEFGSINGYDNKITLLKLKPNDYFKTVLLPRNRKTLSRIKEKYPDLEVIVFYRDLHDGKDAHGHQKYRRYALVPLD